MITSHNEAFITKFYPKSIKVFRYRFDHTIKDAGILPFLYKSLKEENDDPIKSLSINPKNPEESLHASLRRTKTTISDLLLCNDFDSFATFTFNCSNCVPLCRNKPCICDPRNCLRNNPNHSKQRMSTWLASQRKQYGNFGYVVVPEFHKDKKAIHFHAVFRGYEGKITTSSKKTKHGRTIYNIKSYEKGHNTLVKIDDLAKVSSYIKKYVTKDMPVFSGKKRYWCSTRLDRPVVTHNDARKWLTDISFSEVYSKNMLTVFEAPVSIELQQ